MRSSWKIAVPVMCIILLNGAAIAWQVEKGEANQRTLDEAVGLYRARADKGDAKAQYELGHMYYHGKGVQQDYAEAIRWYGKAADQGDARAQYAIGYMYYHGQGIMQNYPEALRWYDKSADQGNTKAQYELGYMYYHGKGVQQDYGEAVRWFQKGAELGDPMAEDGLGFAYYQGNGVTQDYAEAVRWFRKAADQGDAGAQYDLGCMYYDGKGVQQDYGEAARWYRKAADQGDARSQHALGLRTHPSTFSKIYLSLALLGSVLLLIDSRFPKQRIRDRQRRSTALTGILGLLWVGSTLYGFSHFAILQFGLLVNAFYFTKSLLAGTFFVMLVFLLWAQGTKIILTISATLFLGFNAYVIAHHNLRHIAPASRIFYSTNGALIGMTLVAAVALCLPARATQKT